MATIEGLSAPNGAIVRIVSGGAVLNDLGPAAGRTGAYVHRILANVPSFKSLVEKKQVGSREGYILPIPGLVKLLQILEDTTSKTEANEESLKEFCKWVKEELIPILQERFGNHAPIPCKIRLVVEGQVDIRITLDDLERLKVEIERQDSPKSIISGSQLTSL